MTSLSLQEVMIIVNRWIGVDGGYLGDFTYRTHREFYPEYCGVDYDPDALRGTTRERFIKILSEAPPRDQARIVRGVLERFPLGGDNAPSTRTTELRDRLLESVDRIEKAGGVQHPNPRASSEVVRRVLADAETLIGTAEAGHAVDRVHTALHGHLIALCSDAGIQHDSGESITTLFKILRTSHPELQDPGPRSDDVTSVLRAMGSIVDKLQPVRNQASLAHPNPKLLAEPEAMLVINAARTIFHYLEMKLSGP